jgi:predicted 3-demethylubiquinone-9 3-methyltransferase (glyoxalase superfamily)
MKQVVPFLWFDDNLEDALELYTSVFGPETIVEVQRAGPGPGAPAMSATFRIRDQEFFAFNAGPAFHFNEAISVFVRCADQAEVDRLWAGLTADGGEPGRCAWLKDRFGLSWQIVPNRLVELLGDPDPARAERARTAMLGMGRIDIAALEAAAEGAPA